MQQCFRPPRPRAACVVAEGVPHHITQRGDNRQDVFLFDEDRRRYLDILRAKCRDHGVAVLGYCLLSSWSIGTTSKLNLIFRGPEWSDYLNHSPLRMLLQLRLIMVIP